MSKDPFGDLDAAMGGESTDTDEPASEPETVVDEESETESATEPQVTPAFEFEATVHKALYVLQSVADEFDDIITYDVERELTREHGLKNVTKSEIHNAALAVVSEHPELIVERVREQRDLGDE
ncbi:hypothetical protein ACFQJC_05920 [Haloferax namakaokahaiae]|uniref:Uncharacterized protein n=1 Tax=Haloferax namakaokahaiae TaxID=1748331 RepID=A0ABD5ZCW9_9EURY